MKHIGTTMRWFRARVGWTQRELANRLGYSVCSVSRLEVGGGWSPALIEQWQKAFGVDLYVLHRCRTCTDSSACSLACVWDQKVEKIIDRLIKEASDD